MRLGYASSTPPLPLPCLSPGQGVPLSLPHSLLGVAPLAVRGFADLSPVPVDGSVDPSVLPPLCSGLCLRDGRLRSTCVGANNRLDMLSLVTSGLGEEGGNGGEEDEDVLSLCHDWGADETGDPDVPAVSHRRGMSTFVFVPFAQV